MKKNKGKFARQAVSGMLAPPPPDYIFTAAAFNEGRLVGEAVTEQGRQQAPEEKLWQAVLRQAKEDMMTSQRSNPRMGVTQHFKEDARKWLSYPSRDLQMVCDLAGVFMDQVIRCSRNVTAKDQLIKKKEHEKTTKERD
jgi:hypothetical protein